MGGPSPKRREACGREVGVGSSFLPGDAIDIQAVTAAQALWNTLSSTLGQEEPSWRQVWHPRDQVDVELPLSQKAEGGMVLG